MQFNNDNNNIPIIQIMWISLISFFTAFTKELNDLAKNPKEGFLRFISETLLSGVCGTLIGILSMYFINNVLLITFCSGVGGILGIQLIKILAKMILLWAGAIRNIDMSKVNINLDEDSESNDKTGK